MTQTPGSNHSVNWRSLECRPPPLEMATVPSHAPNAYAPIGCGWVWFRASRLRILRASIQSSCHQRTSPEWRGVLASTRASLPWRRAEGPGCGNARRCAVPRSCRRRRCRGRGRAGGSPRAGYLPVLLWPRDFEHAAAAASSCALPGRCGCRSGWHRTRLRRRIRHWLTSRPIGSPAQPSSTSRERHPLSCQRMPVSRTKPTSRVCPAETATVLVVCLVRYLLAFTRIT